MSKDKCPYCASNMKDPNELPRFTIIFEDEGATWVFEKAVSLHVEDGETSIGYFDKNEVYHNEVGDTPRKITIKGGNP